MTDGNPTSETAPTILLVEDSRLFTSVLSFRFQNELGLNVQHCGSFAALQQQLQSGGRNFALAMVDLNLPGSPRGEVLNLTLERDIPTIVFTASFSAETRAEVMQRHVIDYVMKDNDLALEKAFGAVRQALEFRKMKALVVDRSEEGRASLKDALHRTLLAVDEAACGWDALALMEKQVYPLVVVAENVSDMIGYDLVRRIRKLHGASQMAVIGVYTEDDEFNGVNFLRAGASDAIRLPLLHDDFTCRISHHMDMLGQLRSLRATAASDYLTGLYNRRFYFAEGPKLVDRCLKRDRHACIGVLDIDHFKRLNDTYGHEIGDLVLVAVAARLKGEVEGTEHLLCRLGGEEFGILAIGLDAAGATTYFDELRHRISTVKVVADEEELSVSVSIGVAEIRGYETFDNYINAADQFLYMAKHRGRNQVYSDYLMAEEASQSRRVAS